MLLDNWRNDAFFVQELGHEKFAARDHNTSSGSKSWASFPCKRELFEYIERLPNADRCVYELITSESRVCMWFDIEFLSDQQQDGEVRTHPPSS